MKKIIGAIAFWVLACVVSLYAQQQKPEGSSSFKPGWYLGVNGGANMFLAEGNNFLNPNKAHVFSFGQNGSFLGNLSAMYKFTPVVGLKSTLGFHHYKWSTVPQNTDGTYPYYLFSSENLTADLMVNLSNWFGGYNPDRKLDFSLFAGVGGAYANQAGVNAEQPTTQLSPWAALGRGGLQLDYHLNNAWDLNLIVENTVTTDNLNENNNKPLSFDAVPAMTLGFAYRLPEKTKKPAATPVVEPKTDLADNTSVTEAKKDSVKEKVTVPDVTEQQIAQTETRKETKETEEVKEKVSTPVVSEGYVAGLNEKVFFTINSAYVSELKHKDELAEIAKFAKEHPNAIITVSGYADKSTGSIDGNNMMSKMRAVNLANLLIRQYGVSYRNIHVKWYGAGVQPYRTPAKNRLVIVKSPATKNGISLQKEKEYPAEVVPAQSVSVTKKDSVPAEPDAPLFSTINFTDNSFDILNEKQEAEIKKVALYMRKFPTTKILISGYADKNAGSVEKNAELSKKRAVAVANMLIQKYSINFDRIQTKWFGGTKQPSATPSMNRIVLIETIKF